MRVVVYGGRDYLNRLHVFQTLDRLHARVGIEVIIEGGAIGADRQGRLWAQARGIEVATFSADWIAHPRAGGIIRNGEMLAQGRPDLAVAFPGGRGTQDMTRRARRAGVPLIEA